MQFESIFLLSILTPTHLNQGRKQTPIDHLQIIQPRLSALMRLKFLSLKTVSNKVFADLVETR